MTTRFRFADLEGFTTDKIEQIDFNLYHVHLTQVWVPDDPRCPKCRNRLELKPTTQRKISAPLPDLSVGHDMVRLLISRPEHTHARCRISPTTGEYIRTDFHHTAPALWARGPRLLATRRLIRWAMREHYRGAAFLHLEYVTGMSAPWFADQIRDYPTKIDPEVGGHFVEARESYRGAGSGAAA